MNIIFIMYLLTTIALTLAGMISFMSNYYEFHAMNIILGIILFLMGIMILKRNTSLQKILKSSSQNKLFIRYEIVFASITLLVSLVIFSGAFHRFFIEHMSLFG